MAIEFDMPNGKVLRIASTEADLAVAIDLARPENLKSDSSHLFYLRDLISNSIEALERAVYVKIKPREWFKGKE